MVERDLWGPERIAPVNYAEGCYDVVLALFGAGSTLSDEELRRIPHVLRPGGRAAVMFRDGHIQSPTTRPGSRP
jgi:hypothetical protein